MSGLPALIARCLLDQLRWLLFALGGAVVAAGAFATWIMVDRGVFAWRLALIAAAAALVAVAWAILFVRTWRRTIRRLREERRR